MRNSRQGDPVHGLAMGLERTVEIFLSHGFRGSRLAFVVAGLATSNPVHQTTNATPSHVRVEYQGRVVAKLALAAAELGITMLG